MRPMEDVIAIAVALGHERLEDDSPGPPSKIERLTCEACGLAVIKCGAHYYGSALEHPCGPKEDLVDRGEVDYAAHPLKGPVSKTLGT